ncbi:hypothetical protein QYE76_009410 [Lolium multiflorum]|uniref:CCHC-type domain-containing protein n=1 Tax=Lolium multiflorum TaxID=4521 RepID=A0AAD8TV68_LOLMU|nr:hypothetical protein QYE76_009410 [Lolium multiflorum]
MSKLVQGLTEVEDNELVDTAKFDKRVRAQIGVSRLSDAGGAANTISPVAQSSDVRPAQIVGKSPIRRLKNVPCNQSADATDVGGASTSNPLNVLDPVSSPVIAERTNVVAEVHVVEQTRVTRSVAKAACAANVPGKVDKVPVVNFSDNMLDVESYHSANDSDYVDESVTARFVIQSKGPVDASEYADIMLSECAAVPSQPTLSGVAIVVPGVSPELGASGVPMHIDGAVAEPSEDVAVIVLMGTNLYLKNDDDLLGVKDASVDAPVSSVGVKSGFGTSVTNQTTDTVGDVAHHASVVIGTTVDVARDAEQNATIFPQELKAQVTSLKKNLVKGHEGKQSPNDKSGHGFNSNNKKKSTTHKRKKGQGHVKDPAKIVCFKCKIEGHHVRSCPLKKKPLGEKKQGKRPQDGAKVKLMVYLDLNKGRYPRRIKPRLPLWRNQVPPRLNKNLQASNRKATVEEFRSCKAPVKQIRFMHSGVGEQDPMRWTMDPAKRLRRWTIPQLKRLR